MGKNLLVLGGTGFVGSYILQELIQQEFKIYATTTRDLSSFDFHHDQITWIQISFDSNHYSTIEKLFSRTKPDIIINTIAASVSSYTTDPELVDLLNNQINHSITNFLLQDYPKTSYFLLSTSYVFDNISGSPNENEKPDCSTIYGTTKLAGEIASQSLGDQVHIIRVTTVWDNLLLDFQHSNILLDVFDQEKRQNIIIFDNVYRTPTIASQVAEAIVDYILSKNYLPVLHLSHNQIQSFAFWIQQLPKTISNRIKFDSYFGDKIPTKSGLTTLYPQYSKKLDTINYLKNFEFKK